MVDVTILVKAEGKRHDIVLTMFWTTIIVDILMRHPHPGPKTSTFTIISQFRLLILRIVYNTFRNLNKYKSIISGNITGFHSRGFSIGHGNKVWSQL